VHSHRLLPPYLRLLARIINSFVVTSSSMGGIPPARFANHAPFSIMFSDATISGKRCRHLNIIALPLYASVGSITNYQHRHGLNQQSHLRCPVHLCLQPPRPPPFLENSALALSIQFWSIGLGHLGTPGLESPQMKHASTRCFCGLFHSFDTFKALNRSLASLHSLLMSIR
jgi:hypothetical protein